MFKFIEQTLNQVVTTDSEIVKQDNFTTGKIQGKPVVMGNELTKSRGKYNFDIYKRFPLSEGIVNFGQTARWRLYGPHKIKEIYLQLTLDRLSDTQTPSPATNTICYLPAPMLIEQIGVFHKNVEIQRIYPDDEYLKYEMITDHLTKAEKKDFLGVGTPAERAVINSDAPTHVVNVPIWTYLQDLDLYMNLLSGGEIYLEVKFKNPERVVESDTANVDPDITTVNISGYQMLVKMQEYNFSVRHMMMRRQDRVRRVLKSDHYRIPITGSVNSIQRVLKDLKPANVAYFMFWLTDAVTNYNAGGTTTDAQNLASRNYDFTTAEAITDFQLRDKNGREFKYTFEIDNSFYNGSLQHDWFERHTHQDYVKNKNFRVWSFSDNCVDAHTGRDYSSFPMSGDEELLVTLANNTSGTKTLNILVWSYAMVKYDANEGTIKVLQ